MKALTCKVRCIRCVLFHLDLSTLTCELPLFRVESDAVAWCRCFSGCQGCWIGRVTRRSWRKEIAVRRAERVLLQALWCYRRPFFMSRNLAERFGNWCLATKMLSWLLSVFSEWWCFCKVLHMSLLLNSSREHTWYCSFPRLLVTSAASGCLCDGQAKVLHCHVFSGKWIEVVVRCRRQMHGLHIKHCWGIEPHQRFISLAKLFPGLGLPQLARANPNMWFVATFLVDNCRKPYHIFELKSAGRFASDFINSMY